MVKMGMCSSEDRNRNWVAGWQQHQEIVGVLENTQ
jgi:hypothetical protein